MLIEKRQSTSTKDRTEHRRTGHSLSVDPALEMTDGRGNMSRLRLADKMYIGYQIFLCQNLSFSDT